MDYEFPSWCQLRVKILEKLDAEIAKDQTSLDHRLAVKWKQTINRADFNVNTIDHVISENYGNLVERHWIVQIIKNILSECEKDDFESQTDNVRWVEKLSAKFEELLRMYADRKDDAAILKLLENFTVVSLNYERCFAYYFFPKLRDFFTEAHMRDKDFLSNRSSSLTQFFTTYQPHGSLGFMSIPGKNRIGNPISVVKVADGNKYSNFRSSSNGTSYGANSSEHNHIELVGEGDMIQNYNELNSKVVSGAKYCLIIGLSDIGLEGCQIDWSKFEKVFYSGRQVPSSTQGNFNCMNKYANDIVELLCL